MAKRHNTDSSVSAVPMPTYYPDDSNESLPEELFDKDLFQFTEPSITYPEESDSKTKLKARSK